MEAGEAPGSDLIYCLSQRREKRNRGRRRHQESSQLHGERWRSRGSCGVQETDENGGRVEIPLLSP